MRMTGTAANRADLEALKITQIDYSFANGVSQGKSYRQTFNPAITYALIPNKTVDPKPTPSPSKGGGGCDAGVGVFGALMLAAWAPQGVFSSGKAGIHLRLRKKL